MEAALALASDMTQTLVLSNAGIALAAPQVGHAVRMFVIRPSCARRFGMHHVIINPSWRPASQKARRREGCLSFPGVFVDKQRHPAIVAEWTDHAGKHRKKTITDPLLAQIFQHEVEHLTGVLLTDR
jgi:peptide deformylase